MGGRGPSRGARGRRLQPSALEQRPDLGGEPRHRLLVVVGREAGDQVAIAERDVRRQLLGDILRRPDRLVLPGPGDPVALERRPEAPFGLGPIVADDEDPDAVVRSISEGSRPTAAQCSSRIASLRRTASIPPPMLFMSAYWATSLRVTFSPPPPTQIGRWRWTGRGSFRTWEAR